MLYLPESKLLDEYHESTCFKCHSITSYKDELEQIILEGIIVSSLCYCHRGIIEWRENNSKLDFSIVIEWTSSVLSQADKVCYLINVRFPCKYFVEGV